MDAKQKFALVTGATSGIGYELAKLLAKDGYNLFIVGREQQSLNAVAQEFEQNGIEVISFEKDLFNENAAFEVRLIYLLMMLVMVNTVNLWIRILGKNCK